MAHAHHHPDPEHGPVAAYGGLTVGFATLLGACLAAAGRRGRGLPERPHAGDVVLAGFATHKIARLAAKDRVTSFIRAPFTRRQGDSGHGEVEEAAVGTGARRAIGELLVCPYCLGQWVAGAYACGLVAAPRATRFIGAMYTAETIADFLQLAYSAAEERA